MATETINAWFLHKRLSGEKSYRVIFFTQEHGIIEALYKGGRAPKKQALLQPFTPLWLALDVKHEWYYVRQLEFESSALPLHGHLLFSALYLNELLYLLLKPRDPDPDLYVAYVTALHELSHSSDHASIEPILRRFEKILLSAVGYALDLCCEANSDKEIDASSYYHFIPGVGLLPAQEGLKGEYIHAFAEDRLVCTESRRVAKSITRKAVSLAVEGKEIQSRKFFQV